MGGVRLVVDGLWAKGNILMCQLPIKKLKTTNKKGESLVPRGFTSHQKAQTDGTAPVRVVVGVRLIVDGMWAELWRALGDNSNFYLKVVKKTTIDQVKMAQKQKQGHYLSERCDDNGV